MNQKQFLQKLAKLSERVEFYLKEGFIRTRRYDEETCPLVPYKTGLRGLNAARKLRMSRSLTHRIMNAANHENTRYSTLRAKILFAVDL